MRLQNSASPCDAIALNWKDNCFAGNKPNKVLQEKHHTLIQHLLRYLSERKANKWDGMKTEALHRYVNTCEMDILELQQREVVHVSGEGRKQTVVFTEHFLKYLQIRWGRLKEAA
jgi:hypothetical protein